MQTGVQQGSMHGHLRPSATQGCSNMSTHPSTPAPSNLHRTSSAASTSDCMSLPLQLSTTSSSECPGTPGTLSPAHWTHTDSEWEQSPHTPVCTNTRASTAEPGPVTAITPRRRMVRLLMKRAYAHGRMGEYDEQEECLVVALAQLSAGTAYPDLIRECLHSLAGLYEVRGEHDKAHEIREEAATLQRPLRQTRSPPNGAGGGSEHQQQKARMHSVSQGGGGEGVRGCVFDGAAGGGGGGGSRSGCGATTQDSERGRGGGVGGNNTRDSYAHGDNTTTSSTPPPHTPSDPDTCPEDAHATDNPPHLRSTAPQATHADTPADVHTVVEAEKRAIEAQLRVSEGQCRQPCDYQSVAERLRERAGVYESRGEADVAVALYECALSVVRAAVPKADHPCLATHVSEHACALQRLVGPEGLPRCLELYQEALRLVRKSSSSSSSSSSLSSASSSPPYAGGGGGSGGGGESDVATACNNVASVLMAMGTYADAQPLFEEALRIRRQELLVCGGGGGEGVSSGYVTALHNCGTVRDCQGEYARAKELYDEAVHLARRSIDEAADGSVYTHTPGADISVHHDAHLSQSQTRTPTGVERVQRERYTDLATSLNNLAILHIKRGQYGTAMTMCDEALGLRRRWLLEHHVDVYVSMLTLAGVHHKLAAYDEARKLYDTALEGLKRSMPQSHAETAACLDHYARLCCDLGEYDQSLNLAIQGLEMRRRHLPPRHPDVATSLHTLGELYVCMGEYVRAKKVCREALEIRRERLKESHPDTAIAIMALADVCVVMGEGVADEPVAVGDRGGGGVVGAVAAEGGAVAMYAHALRHLLSALPPTHPRIAACTASHGWAVVAAAGSRNDHAHATRLVTSALKTTREALREAHPQVAWTLDRLGCVYMAQGRYDTAVPLLREALELRRKALPPTHPYTAETMVHLAEAVAHVATHTHTHVHARHTQGPTHAQGGEPRLLLTQALDVLRGSLQPRHPLIASCLCALAQLYMRRSMPSSAEPLLVEAVEIRKWALPAQHRDVTRCVCVLAEVCEMMGDHKRALRLYEHAYATLRRLRPAHADTSACLTGMLRCRSLR